MRKTLSSFFISILFLACSHRPERHMPRKEIKTTITKHYKMIQDLMGFKVTIEGGSVFFYTTGIEEDNGIVRASTKVIRAVMETNVKGQRKIYDSDNKDDLNGIYGPTFKRLLSDSIEMKLSADDGRIISKGNANATSKALEALSSPDFYNRFSKELFLFSGKIKPGNKFTIEDNTDGRKESINYLVDSITGKEAFLHFTGSEHLEKEVTISGTTVKSASQNSISGTVVVDTATHIIRQRINRLSGTGTAKSNNYFNSYSNDQTDSVFSKQ